MDLKKLNIDQVLLPQWNVKRKKDLELFRIRNSVQRLGQTQPIKVRDIGTKDMLDNQLFEIIDGRTVYAALLDCNIKEVYCLDYGTISEQQATTLYLQTEFSGKTTDPLRLAELINGLNKAQEVSTLQNTLPFDKDQIQYYIDLCDFDWRKHLSKNHKDQGSLF